MIRIKQGNDVKFNVAIKSDYTFDYNNIKRIQSYFVRSDVKNYNNIKDQVDDVLELLYDDNTSVVDFDNIWYNTLELQSCVCQDLPDDYCMHRPNKHCIGVCGPHGYHTSPCNYTQNPIFGKRFAYNTGMRKGITYRECMDRDMFAKWCIGKTPKILKPGDVCKAYTTVTDQVNRIHVYFPAREQRTCGKYDLVIKLLAYEEGWGPNDLRTYTMEYKDVIQITDEPSGTIPDAIIDMDENGNMYQCSVAVLNMIPPLATATAVNATDQSFEYDYDFGARHYDINVLYSSQEEFDTEVVPGSEMTYTISANAENLDVNYIYVMSGKPIRGIAIGRSQFMAPFVDISERSGEYIYAVSNPIQNVENIPVTIYFK